MHIFRKYLNKQRAFSLIEVLIIVFIMSVAFVTFYTVATVGTKYIIEAKNRLAATALVNEKMEIVRNLEYDAVGTQGSIDIPGNLLQTENVVANGRSYQVLTSVRYFDDPLASDGTAETSPADPIPNDYKVVRITVAWIDASGQTQNVSATSRFVPPGLEGSAGGSPLSINVTSDDTLPVSQATIHITNNNIIPVVNDTIQTDNNGHVMFPDARISNENHLTITKAGYETIATMDKTATFTPVYKHVNVIAGALNAYNYHPNKLANLTVKSADYENNSIGDVEFSIGGGKILGNDTVLGDIYSMSNTTGTTGATSGEKEYGDISSGSYTITMSSNTQYEFIDYDPSVFPLFLPSDNDMTYILRLADKNVNALFLEIKDSDVSQAPVAGAKVTLKDGGTDIFTEKESSLRGVVFYSNGTTPLESKTYDLEVTADGYDSETQTVTIDKLTHVIVYLTRI